MRLKNLFFLPEFFKMKFLSFYLLVILFFQVGLIPYFKNVENAQTEKMEKINAQYEYLLNEI
jgi:hypothetical protein